LGLSIWLDRKNAYLSFDEQLYARLKLASEVVAYYSNYFVPSNIEVWENSTVESLGGKIVRSIPVGKDLVGDIRDVTAYVGGYGFPQKGNMIVRILGNWSVGKLPRVLGYVFVANERILRSVYGDVSMNAFSSGEIEDVVHLFLYDKTLARFLIDDFAERFGHYEDEFFRVRSLYFHEGAPARNDVTTLVAAHYSSINPFLYDAIMTIEDQGGEEIADSIAPYRSRFLVKSMKDVPDLQPFLEELFTKYGVVYNPHGSVVLSSRERDTFAKLFSELSDKVLKPMATELPNRKILSAKVRTAIEGKGLKGQTKLG
jgi:hypothetical protein